MRTRGDSSLTRSRRRPASHRPAAAVEPLEGRRLLAGDFNVVRPIPFAYDWNTDHGGAVKDRFGQGTGFDFVYPNKLGDEYEPSRVDLSSGEGLLKITSSGSSTSGSNFDSDNTLRNALGVQFDALSNAWAVTVTLKGPLTAINEGADQAGVIVGPDQDNYIKMVAAFHPNGPAVQFIDEQVVNGSIVHNRSVGNSFTFLNTSFRNMQTLQVRITADPSAGTFTAFYAINDGPFSKVGYDISLRGDRRAAFFNTRGRVGILSIHKHDGPPLQAIFDRFEMLQGPAASLRPRVIDTRPADNATGVRRDAFIAADIEIPNPGKGIRANTLNDNTVKLRRASDGLRIPANYNTSGAGDSIVVQPLGPLDPNTRYTLEFTEGITDTAGGPMVARMVSFTTGTAINQPNPNIAFERVELPNAINETFTGVTVGPDARLYAGTFDGKIYRFHIEPDGTLNHVFVNETVRRFNGGPRTITGLRFQPGTPAGDPVLWVSHGVYDGSDGANSVTAEDWTGKISRLTGGNLDFYQDVVVRLPRSIRDHLTNQIDFGPDGAMYFAQASNTAMGNPDSAWGLRREHLLNAAILRLDVSKITTFPLDAKTEEGGTYNPFVPSSSLTIFASGVRNAYDLVWHSSGRLYAPVNGSAAGGATPGFPHPFGGTRIDQAGAGPYTGPEVRGLTFVNETQPDYLLRIEQGRYYGHPNPLRMEYVLNGGNPTSNTDTLEVKSYPVGTQPDRNYRAPVHTFGRNYAPAGAVEYRGSAFGGQLRGRLLVTRFSGGDDIVVMDVGADGGIPRVQAGIAGLARFDDPVDVTEDQRTGFLYVAEYGARKLTLLRPVMPGGNIEVTTPYGSAPPRLYVNDSPDAGSGPARRVLIKNTGSSPLALQADALSLIGPDASQFVITRRPALPATIQPGQSVEVFVAMLGTGTAPVVRNATLRIRSNDSDTPTVDVPVRGLLTSGTGGELEPSLHRILVDLFTLPINVGDRSPHDVFLDNPPARPNDEIFVPRFHKAGNGPVTIEPLAAFGVNSTPAVRFGYYKPGTPAEKTPLSTIAAADAQSVLPPTVGTGATKFDPFGDMFSLYAIFPNFKDGGREREVYGEDALNLWEPNAANRRKVRVYPLKNPDGSTVADAYVVAFEEFTSGYDNQDFVAILRNVRPAAAGPELGLENLDATASSGPFQGVYPDRLVFNRIQNPDNSGLGLPNNVVHDVATVRVRNTGSDPLVIGGLGTQGPFVLENHPGTPLALNPNATLDLRVRFVATSAPDGSTSRPGMHTGILVIANNDADESNTVIDLAGWWQPVNEGAAGLSFEPNLATNLQLLGFTTPIVHPGQNIDTGGQRTAAGDEVLAEAWVRADTSLPVSVRQLAAWHTQGNDAILAWHDKASTSTTRVFVQTGPESQSFFPRVTGGAAANGSFRPNGALGWRIDAEWSTDSRNPQEQPGGNFGHHVRLFPARDRRGDRLPNTWLLTMDYSGINYDYNDNVYLVTNIRPEHAPATPQGLAAVPTADGIALDWTNNAEAVAGYRVFRATAIGGPFTRLTAETLLTASEFLDTTAQPGVQYHYLVKAVNAAGVESTGVLVKALRA